MVARERKKVKHKSRETQKIGKGQITYGAPPVARSLCSPAAMKPLILINIIQKS
jgi:hypothetical protein